MICIVSGGGVARLYEGVPRPAIPSDGDGLPKVVWTIISVIITCLLKSHCVHLLQT